MSDTLAQPQSAIVEAVLGDDSNFARDTSIHEAPGRSLPRLRIYTRASRDDDCLRPSTTRWLRGVTRRILNRRRPYAAQVGICIDDLRGASVYRNVNGGKVVDVSLPAGVYHVLATAGDTQQRYTLKLTPGKTLHLYLHPRSPTK